MPVAEKKVTLRGRRDMQRSNAQFHRASRRMPLGVSSNFRYWGADNTIYIDHGRGARLWDIDGNEYIDYRLAYGPVILGYADRRVDAAAREAMEIGGVFALSTEKELEVAERVAKMVPAAELVRFSNSGTEAVMAAVRLARAHTGKDNLVMVEGGYHGIFDWVLWGVSMKGWDPASGEPELEAFSAGVPQALKEFLHQVPLNDANRLEETFKAHGDKIAALLIEPMMGNCCSLTADKQYMQDVRSLCNQYNVVMIVDEVKTGFRVARGGIQEHLGFKADLCTFAKSMANGYPISVVAGREDIMRRFGDGVVHGGTFTCHAVALAAAATTLEILDETDALDNIAAYGEQLREGISKVLQVRGVAHCFVGHPAMSGLFFSDTPPTNYRDWKNTDYTFYESLAPELHKLGILVEPDSREPWFMCEAHDEVCLEETLDKFEQAVGITLKTLSPGEARRVP